MNGRTYRMQKLLTWLTAVLIMTVAVSAAQVVQAADFSVDTLTDESDGSCSDGDCSLRDAIALAAVGDEIEFSVSGTITLTLGELALNKSMTITGPGAANLAISGNNASRVFYIGNPSASVTISGVTIADGNSGTGQGGGIWNYGGTLTLNDCDIINNTSNAGSSVKVGGGGISSNNNGSVNVNSCTFSNNTGVRGGAIHFLDGALTVTDSTFSNNNASSIGAGIYHRSGTTIIKNSTFTGNVADASAGGIFLYNQGTVELLNSTVTQNSANGSIYGGGGIFCQGAPVTIANSTISDNNSVRNGGGIYNWGSALTIQNSTIVNNTADSDNNGSGNGGGIYRDSGTVTVLNTIIADNIDPGGQGPDCSGSMTSNDYNLIEDTTGCTISGTTTNNITGVDPGLLLLSDNGGPTQTHALQLSSPAIDHIPDGVNGCGSTPLDNDQRAGSRPVDGGSGGGCDIGAYEYAEYTLDVEKTGNGSGSVQADNSAEIDCGSDCFEGYSVSTTVNLTATPDPGSYFSGWSGDCSGTTNPLSVTLDSTDKNKTCIANFEKIIVTLTASDSAAAENTPSTETGEFTISRTGSTTNALTVAYTVATGPGQAINDGTTDYSPFLSGTITIEAGNTNKIFSIIPVDDSIVEGAETVTLTLADTINYDLGASGTETATVTIADNDVAGVTVDPTSITVVEGSTTTFNVKLTTLPTADVTVALSSSDPGACGVASSVTIPVGSWSSGVNVSITGVDDADTANESCTITTGDITSTDGDYDSLDGADVVDVAVSVADDDVPILSLNVSPKSFGEGAGTSAAIGTVSRSITSGAVTITLSSSDPSEATVPVSVMLGDGVASMTFAVDAVDDTLVDGDQSVTLTASATGYSADTAGVTVTDDDIPTLTLSVSPKIFGENDGGSAATGTVSRNTTSGAVTISLSSSDTSETTVPASVTLGDGVASTTFAVAAVDDTLVDGDQSVTLTASATGYSDGTTTLTVTDDDSLALTLSVSPTSVSEGAGTSAATGTVSRNTTSGAITVTLSSSDPSEATVPASVTLGDGVASTTFAVAAVDDTLVDGDQSVTLTASATGYSDGTTTLTVTDDDSLALTLSVSPTSVSEGAGTSAATGTVSRNTTSGAITVTLSSSDPSEATVPASVTLSDGVASTTFAVAAVDDTVVDGDQSVTLTASATGYSDGTTTLTVTDDDSLALTLSVSPTSVSEGAGTSAATGMVSRNTTSGAVTISLSSSDPSEATVPTSVTLGDGVASTTFAVAAVDDTLVDGDQSVTLTASATGYTDGTAGVTVTDDDSFGVSIIAPTTDGLTFKALPWQEIIFQGEIVGGPADEIKWHFGDCPNPAVCPVDDTTNQSIAEGIPDPADPVSKVKNSFTYTNSYTSYVVTLWAKRGATIATASISVDVGVSIDSGVGATKVIDTSLGTNVLCSPVMGDLDGDGYLEIVTSDGGDEIRVFTADGGDFFPPNSLISNKGIFTSSPLLADITGDNRPEIFALDSLGYLWGWNADGTNLWGTGMGDTYLKDSKIENVSLLGTPAIGDVDGVNGLDVVWGGDDGGAPATAAVAAYNLSNLTPLFSTTLGNVGSGDNYPRVSAVALANVNSDSTKEVFIGYNDRTAPAKGKIVQLNSSGSVMFTYEMENDEFIGHGSGVLSKYVNSAPTIGPVTNTSTMDILVGGSNGNLYVWNAGVPATPVAKQNLGAAISSVPALAYLNYDEKVDVIIANEIGTVYALYYDGGLQNVAGWPVSIGASPVVSPVIGDVNSDNLLEVVIARMGSGRVFVLKYNGEIEQHLTSIMMTDNRLYASPAMGDPDRDGAYDVVVTDEKKLYRWEVPGPITGKTIIGWPFFRANVRRDGAMTAANLYTVSVTTLGWDSVKKLWTIAINVENRGTGTAWNVGLKAVSTQPWLKAWTDPASGKTYDFTFVKSIPPSATVAAPNDSSTEPIILDLSNWTGQELLLYFDITYTDQETGGTEYLIHR